MGQSLDRPVRLFVEIPLIDIDRIRARLPWMTAREQHIQNIFLGLFIWTRDQTWPTTIGRALQEDQQSIQTMYFMRMDDYALYSFLELKHSGENRAYKTVNEFDVGIRLP